MNAHAMVSVTTRITMLKWECRRCGSTVTAHRGIRETDAQFRSRADVLLRKATEGECKSSAPETKPIHRDCICCLAKAHNDDGETALVILMTMLLHNDTPESVERDLCFMHRRRVRDAIAGIEAEEKGS
jgi:hypothetical protein